MEGPVTTEETSIPTEPERMILAFSTIHMAEEDNSTICSISDNNQLEQDRIENLKATLARDAAAKTILNGGYSHSGEDVVKSPHIERMLDAYNVASGGRVIVMCAPAQSGKTRAGEFFLHGKHPYLPDRSLMVSAAFLAEDFAGDVASKLGVASVGPNLGEILCSALAQKSSSAAELVAKAGDFDVDDTALCIRKRSFDDSNEINMYGPEQIPSTAVDCKGLPMLIIDNFNEATDKNKAFVQNLLQEACQFGVFVFILTSNETWATTLVGLNGGAKIKPLHGNVNNSNYIDTDSFPIDEFPLWNSLGWPVGTLRELIRPFCVKHSIDPANVVPNSAVMTPVTANSRALKAAGY
jgi:hypothetical protein